jgi:hypothetical protein
MSGQFAMLNRYISITVVAATLFVSTAVMAATEFQPAAQVVWIKRTEALARIAGDGTTQADADTILANMRSSCDGLQGEQMSHEYGKVPRWALGSQIYACSAFGRWSNIGFIKTKVPCLDVQRGIDALGEIKPADEAAEVVTAATNFRNTLQALLESAKKSGSLRCRY